MSNVPMTLPELMLAEHEPICGHESTFVELDDGRILHVAGFWKNYSEDGGLTCTKMPPEKMVDVNGDPVGGAQAARTSGNHPPSASWSGTSGLTRPGTSTTPAFPSSTSFTPTTKAGPRNGTQTVTCLSL